MFIALKSASLAVLQCERACMRSGKERIASIADSTVLIKIGIGVPRVRTDLRKCVAIVAMVKSLRRFTFILAFRAGMDRWMPRTVSGCVLYYLVE